jgi:hypothetical protein
VASSATDATDTTTTREAVRATTSSSTTTTSTTVASTTSIAPSTTEPLIDELRRPSNASTLQADDFGEAWFAVLPALPIPVPEMELCLDRAPTALAQVGEVAGDMGALMHHRSTGLSVVPFAFALDSASSADHWLDIVRDPAHIECGRARSEADQQDGSPGLQVRISTRPEEATGSLVDQTKRDLLDPAGNVVGFADVLHYRWDRLIVSTNFFHMGPLDATTASAIGTDVQRVVKAALDRAYALS